MKKHDESPITIGQGIFAIVVIIICALVVLSHTRKVETPDAQVIANPEPLIIEEIH